MTHQLATALDLISIVMGVASALLLYAGSLGIPWKMQSWSGESEAEKRYRQIRSCMVWFGIPCVFIVAICQTALVLWPPESN